MKRYQHNLGIDDKTLLYSLEKIRSMVYASTKYVVFKPRTASAPIQVDALSSAQVEGAHSESERGGVHPEVGGVGVPHIALSPTAQIFFHDPRAYDRVNPFAVKEDEPEFAICWSDGVFLDVDGNLYVPQRLVLQDYQDEGEIPDYFDRYLNDEVIDARE